MENQVESTEVPPQFPALTAVPGNLHFQFSIDKSVNKLADRIMGILLGCGIVIGVACVLAIWIVVDMRSAATERRLVDDDWQKMNAFLQAQGVTKDKDGFYTLGKPEDRKLIQQPEK